MPDNLVKKLTLCVAFLSYSQLCLDGCQTESNSPGSLCRRDNAKDTLVVNIKVG